MICNTSCRIERRIRCGRIVCKQEFLTHAKFISSVVKRKKNLVYKEKYRVITFVNRKQLFFFLLEKIVKNIVSKVHLSDTDR